MQKEIHKLTIKKQRFHEREEKQERVLNKLQKIKEEFSQREETAAREARERKLKAKEAMNLQKIKSREVPKQPKPEFHMSAEQESFLTFLNECATSVNSILTQLLGVEHQESEIEGAERFEAPKLTAAIKKVKELTEILDQTNLSELNIESVKKPVLTPATAYFAFSAPFDDTDDFISSENWSFAKYKPTKPPSTASSTSKKPRIVRIKTAPRQPL